MSRVLLKPGQKRGTSRDAFITAIQDLTERMGYPPTMHELRAELGYQSTMPVHYHLTILRDEGRVTWEDGKSRTLRVLS